MIKLFYLLVLLILTGCTVGPDFERPDVPAVERYSQGKDPSQFGVQKTNLNKVITEKWWVDFSSPQLNKVMAYGVKESKTLMYARTAWEQSKDLVDVERGALWPALTLDTGMGREKYGAAFVGTESSLIPPFTYYEIGPSLTYMIDIFGLTRRAIEKQKALSEFHGYVYEAAYLLVTGSILDRAVMIAVLDAEIEALNQIIVEDKKNLKLIEDKLRLGAATQLDLIKARNQLTQDQENLPQLNKKITQVRNDLNVTVGISPAQWQPPKFKLSDFKLPKELPMALPSELVRRRPDILAAEASLHSANATLGITEANFYPSITLNGQVLQEAVTPAHLFRAANTAFGVFGGLTAPIFNGGILRAEKRAAERAYQSALSNYQDVVVKSFVQINNILHALQEDQKADVLGRKTLALAKEALELARNAYSIGAVGIIDVLDAQRQYSKARLDYAQIQGRRLQDSAQLYLAIGGRVDIVKMDQSAPSSKR